MARSEAIESGTHGATAERTRSLDLPALGIVFLGAVLLALPLLIYGPYPKAHDVFEHLNYTYFFSRQFWAGDLYPRWLIDLNHGLGSPSMFVFPCLEAYVYVLLEPVTRILRLNTFIAEEFLVLFISPESLLLHGCAIASAGRSRL